MNTDENKYKILEKYLKTLSNLTKKSHIKNAFKIVPPTITAIDNLNLSSPYFIDKILEVIKNKELCTIVRACLSNPLRTLVMEEEQILKILELVNDKSYDFDFRMNLLFALNKVIESGHQKSIDTAYRLFKTNLSYQVPIGELLLPVSHLEQEVLDTLFEILKNYNIPLEVNNKLEAISLLKDYPQYHTKLIEIIFKTLKNKNYDYNEYYFEDIINTFLSLNPDNEALDRLMALLTDDDEWYIELIQKLKTHSDRIDFYIESLIVNDESFLAEDASSILQKMVLTTEQTDKLLEILESSSTDIKTKITISEVLKNMSIKNPIDIEKLERIYQQIGLTKELYQNINEVLKERRKRSVCVGY